MSLPECPWRMPPWRSRLHDARADLGRSDAIRVTLRHHTVVFDLRVMGDGDGDGSDAGEGAGEGEGESEGESEGEGEGKGEG